MAKKTRTAVRPDTRTAIFAAAATSFSSRGFDGVAVDDIAEAAQVNKAMIYYHFADKLALYRAVVSDMLATLGETGTAIADSDQSPQAKLDQFIANFMTNAEARPWFPTMMLREISEGAPHLDRVEQVSHGGEGAAVISRIAICPLMTHILVLAASGEKSVMRKPRGDASSRAIRASVAATYASQAFTVCG